jgi:hypothetical protein
MYVIKTDEIDEETGDDLYWSNTDGHVNLASATVFTEVERNGMRYIPKGFKIVEVMIQLKSS